MLELIFEVIAYVFGEVLFDLAFHWVGTSDSAIRRLLLIVFFAFCGALIGGLSLLPFPEHLIRSSDLRLASLVLTPIVAGTLFALYGRGRLRKGKEISALEEFWPAFSFALAIAVVRYFGAE